MSSVARWLVSIVGLIGGLALGLVYTWVIDPVEVTNTYPALLRTDYRQDWIRLAAISYVADGDLERAGTRLDGIEQKDVASAMQALIEEYAAAGHAADTLRYLTTLAQALDVHTPAMLVYQHTPTKVPPPPPTATIYPGTSSKPTPSTSPPTPTPFPTDGPTRTPPPPTPAPTPAYQLIEREQICRPGQAPRIEVVVKDRQDAELAGIEVWLMWNGGADRAVTGLKPQNGAGYADFDVEPDTRYSLRIGKVGIPLVTNLQVRPCATQAGANPPVESLHVVLQPRPPESEELESDTGR